MTQSMKDGNDVVKR